MNANRLPGGLRLAAALLALLLTGTGCWNKKELTEFGFVQAAAIDMEKDGQLQLTTLFYKPGGTLPEGTTQPSSQFIVRTRGKTLFEAVRDISIHLGRVAQWSHMRIVLISEKTAQSKQMAGIMDYFLRDHEPRETLKLAIAEGEAGSYLNLRPKIENTIGQQLLEMETKAHHFSGKTRDIDLLHAAIQFRSQSGTALWPLVYFQADPPKSLSVAGVAVFKNGMLVDKLPGHRTEYLLMLRDEYVKGIVEVPCKNDPSMNNALEKVEAQTAMSVRAEGDTAHIRLHVKLEGSYGELRCLNISSTKAETAEIEYVRQMLLRDYRQTIDYMQRNRLDLLDIGDRLFRQNPALWFEWKKDWDERLAKAKFDITVELKITNSGMTMPRTY